MNLRREVAEMTAAWPESFAQRPCRLTLLRIFPLRRGPGELLVLMP